MRSIERLSNFIQLNWKIHPRSFVTIRSVYGILDDRGNRYIAKPVKLRHHAERLEAAATVVERAYNNGVDVIPWLMSNKGKYQCVHGGEFWSIQCWQQGRGSNFCNLNEWIAAIQAAARLHQIQLREIERFKLETPTIYSKYLSRLQLARHTVEEGVAPIQYTEWEKWDKQAEDALQALKLQSAGLPMVFCHRDLAPHNILWEQGKTYFIDFDLSGMDVSVHDLYQLCNHRAFFTGWNMQDVQKGIEAYQKIRPLTNREWEFLFTLWRYPSFITRELYEFANAHAEDGDLASSPRSRMTWAIELEKSRMESLERLMVYLA